MIQAAMWLAAFGALGEWRFSIAHPDQPQPQAPPLLREFWRFRRYGLPPLAGGMRDQPYGWFEHGELLANVYESWRAWLESDKGPDWRKQHPDTYAVVQWIRKANLWQTQS